MQSVEVDLPREISSFSLDPSSLLLTGIALTSIYLLWFRRKTDDDEFTSHVTDDGPLTHFRDLPSPRGFPVIGNAAQLGAEPYRKMAEWAGTLGPLFRFSLGNRDVLVVTGFDLIRKATTKQSIDFGGRPELETTKLFSAKSSISFIDYSKQWMKNKKCATEALKLYTTGKDPTKRSVMEECALRHANNMVDQLLEQASEEDNNAVDVENGCFKMAIKSISEVCFGGAFDLDDPTFAIFANILNNFDKAMGKAQLVNSWPFLKHVPLLGRNFAELKKAVTKYEHFLTERLKDHWRSYNPNEMRDLVDCLKYQSELPTSSEEIKKAADTADNDQETKDIDESLEKSPRPSQGATANGGSRDTNQAQQQGADTNFAAADLFGAGFDTVHKSITWAFFYLAVYPETQTKTTRDPNLWENPEEFRPQRFLLTDPETGGYKLRGEATNRVIAWGLGLRQCPGAQLSRHQIFIILATIVKRCDVAQSRPGFEPAHPWKTELGLSLKAMPFKVSITPL